MICWSKAQASKARNSDLLYASGEKIYLCCQQKNWKEVTNKL